MTESGLYQLLKRAELAIDKCNFITHRKLRIQDRILGRQYVMSYNQQGVCKLQIDGDIVTIEPGTVFLIRPGVKHTQYIDDAFGPASFMYWEFTYMIAGELDVLPWFRIPLVVRLRDQAQFEAVFGQFMDCVRSEDVLDSTILRKAKELELLHILLREMLADRQIAEPANPEFAALLERILTGRGGKLQLARLARDAGMSVSYLSGRFKELFGISPMRLHRAALIDEAKKLLLSSRELTVSAIAETLGFDEVSNFSRLFKSVSGLSPREFRDRPRT